MPRNFQKLKKTQNHIYVRMKAVFVVGLVNDAAPHTTQKTLSVVSKCLCFNNLTLSQIKIFYA